MSVNQDIMNANEIINGKFGLYNNLFHSTSSVYKFTNENISGYYELLNLEGKNILTVCSSGDHILEAILRDAKKVDCFDISIFTKYFMNLKLASVLSLEYDEFITYLFEKTSDKIFYYKFYEKIRKSLKKIDFDSLLFWDSLYNNARGFEIYSSRLFTNMYIGISFFENKENSYLNKENYYILKTKLEKYLSLNKNILFEQSNVTDISKKFKDKYDLIFLSNIASYMENIYVHNAEINFYDLITKEIKTLLTEKGLIEVAYLYSDVTLSDFTNYCLNNTNFDILSFDSFYEGKTSHILTYKK